MMYAAVDIAIDVAAVLTAVTALLTALFVFWNRTKHRLGAIERDVRIVGLEVATGNGSTNGEYAVRTMEALEDIHSEIETLRGDVRALTAAMLAHVTDHKLH